MKLAIISAWVIAVVAVLRAGEISDRYDINLNQSIKYEQGIKEGYFEESEFIDTFRSIERKGEMTELTFDAVLVFFFNENRNKKDDWKVENWSAETDSEYEYVGQYDLDWKEHK